MIGRIEVDERSLARLVAALNSESDGRELGHDLVRELTAVAEPALNAARASLMSMASESHALPGLRATVARHTRIRVRLSGKHPGVSIRADKSGMPRGFDNAPKRLNSARGWRHMVFGDANTWVTQRGKPGWFDDTISTFKPAARRAAQRALDDVARRIDSRTRG
jgi:hypothetical protein